MPEDPASPEPESTAAITTATADPSPTSPTAPTDQASPAIPAIPNAAPAPHPFDHTSQREAFHRQWWDTVRRELETTPDLKDENSALGQTLQSILQETSIYSLTPDGFHQAAELARARHAASGVPALQSKLESLTRENERLIKLTSVTGSGPAKLNPSDPADFSERDLRRLAFDHDNA